MLPMLYQVYYVSGKVAKREHFNTKSMWYVSIGNLYTNHMSTLFCEHSAKVDRNPLK